jgi:prepilin-type N-terminal cleavage/methylation domain-containing protein/prepilin-type processing-associated H-X9-DG protein
VAVITSSRNARSAFTLIELLVVIAIIAILASVLMPVLTSARAAGQRSVCSSQIKQIAAAILMYADDSSGHFVPAASDIIPPGKNLHRWHGERDNANEPFDPKRGPVYRYLGKSSGIKRCPSARMLKDQTQSPNAFEAGCGGYGYNQYYVGGTYYRNSGIEAAEQTPGMGDLASPRSTVMLTDTAMALTYPDQHLIEYSFCEPPFMLWGAGQSFPCGSPSIHFRHGTVNVAWCDGHVSSERMSFSSNNNIYGADSRAVRIGWFGPRDNSLFDNK